MFTGIIEAKGKITAIGENDGMVRLTVAVTNKDNFTAQLGASIAINGCCLTVTPEKTANESTFHFDVSKESLSKTNIGQLQVGSIVNMERAARLGDHMGGHLVSGHVDGIGTVTAVGKDSDGWNVSVRIPKSLRRYLIEKGSICLDGVSLTINRLSDHADYSEVGLTLIPTTLNETTFAALHPGQMLNVEVDMIGKYLERLRLDL